MALLHIYGVPYTFVTEDMGAFQNHEASISSELNSLTIHMLQNLISALGRVIGIQQ